MEKRLYIKPETVTNDIVLSHSILDPSQGIAPGGLAKENEEFEEGIHEESDKPTTDYSLW